MSKKLLDILPTLQTFQDNVITQLTNMFNGVEWLNDTTSYTKQETIYKLLMLKYGDRQIRYDDENIFLNRLVFDLADFLPDIYAKQQVFIKNKLNEFLSDNKNRAVIIDNTSTNSRNTDNNTKFGNSSSPLNLVISNANEITNAPITSLNLSNVKLLENYNGTNQQVNYNFVNDLIKTLNNDYSLRLNEFMELLGKHFISVVGGYYRNTNDIQTVKDEPYRFNNGYLVNEVDYLCSDNKQEINRFNEKLGRLNDQVATKQNQLTAGNNISINNNVISANIPQPDLSNYYTKQEIDTQQQQQNTNITNNTTLLGRLNTDVATNTNSITTNQNNITNLENRYTVLNNEVVKLEGSQNINGPKTFTGTTTFGTEINAGWGGNPVKFIPDDNRTKTLQFYENSVADVRRFNILVPNPTEAQNPATKNYVDNSNNQNVKLTGDQAISGTKTFNNQIVANEGLTTGTTKSITSCDLELGLGNTTAYITPEDNSNKTLKFGGRSGKGRFNLDLENTSQLQGVKDPTRDYHAANKKYVDNLNNQNVKLAGQQEITGKKIFTAAGEAIQIKPSTAAGSSYIAGYDGTTKKWVIGNTGQNNDMLLEATAGNINLKTGASGNIQCYNKLVRQVADPTNDTDAVNKRYVHNFINYKEEQATITPNNQNQINPTPGYQIIDLKVARKRSEGYWFFDYHTTLNIQLFIHTNGKYTIYNNGAVSGFSNDFKIFIIEKKV